MRAPVPVTVTVTVMVVACGVLQWLGRSDGATRAERKGSLPGDELTRRPLAITTHAITIAAPPARIWPWLVQMGWHRGGWYTTACQEVASR